MSSSNLVGLHDRKELDSNYQDSHISVASSAAASDSTLRANRVTTVRGAGRLRADRRDRDLRRCSL